MEQGVPLGSPGPERGRVVHSPICRWVRFEVAARARPPVVCTLQVGEVAHLAAMAQYGRLTDGAMTTSLSGRTGDGRPSQGQHTHAHYLSMDDDGDDLIDHLRIWVPRGLDAQETAACLMIDGLRESSHGSVSGVGLVLPLTVTGVGWDLRHGFESRLIGPSAAWCSVTPFVPSRHTKQRGTGQARRLVDAPHDQLVREVAQRGIGARVVGLEPLPEPPSGKRSRWLWSSTLRGQARGRLPALSLWWRITFDRPVWGPLLFGHGAHFGLGLFAVADAIGTGG